MSLKGLPQSYERGGMSDREPNSNCWKREPQSVCLRVELASGEIFVLPYQHFVAAHLVRTTDSESLRISFSSYDVSIEGTALRELALALNDLSVASIEETPPRYKARPGGSAITAIRVTPVE
jgi:hypothetical protein